MSNEATKNGELRNHLLYLLKGGGAHISLEDFVSDIPMESINRRLESLPYTIWHVLEHMRIAQWDILEFSRNPSHESPTFPDGYWPASSSVANEESFQRTIRGLQTDLHELQQIIAMPETDLLTPIPHGSGQTILREALLVADHNAYHLGALMVMKRLIGEGQTEDH